MAVKELNNLQYCLTCKVKYKILNVKDGTLFYNLITMKWTEMPHFAQFDNLGSINFTGNCAIHGLNISII